MTRSFLSVGIALIDVTELMVGVVFVFMLTHRYLARGSCHINQKLNRYGWKYDHFVPQDGYFLHFTGCCTAKNLALLDLIAIVQKLECGIMLINRLTHLFDTRIEHWKML